MKRKHTNYDDGEYMQADILGVGSYHSNRMAAGKPKTKPPIGFIRQPPKPKPRIVAQKKK